MPRLVCSDLRYSYIDKTVIDHITLDAKRGEFVGLIGPNGSGKSTILKNIYRALTPDAGTIILDDENVASMSFRKSALKMGVVGQENDATFDFLVEEIVAMGRNPHKKLFEIDTKKDKAIVHHALEHLGMEDMAKRQYQYLSGGEKQRVVIARVIAQESDFLILDEPTNHLDISYQLQIFDLVKRLGITVLAAIHDLNMAAMYCDRIYVLKEGKIVTFGTPEEVLTAEMIDDVYGVKAHVTTNHITHKKNICYLPASLTGQA